MKKGNVQQLCILAFAAALNLIGGTAALLLHLPIYLDTLGTMIAAALFGPFWGVIPGIISGIFSGFTSDIYAFYYIPVQLVTGMMAGIVFRRFMSKNWKIFFAAVIVSLPGTVVSASITAQLFGGITSSGSTVLVQLLHRFGMNLTFAVCAVQVFTDYIDRIVVMAITLMIWNFIPSSMKHGKQKGYKKNGAL